MNPNKKYYLHFFLISIVFLLSACSPTNYTRISDWGRSLIPKVETIGIMITDVNVFSVSAGGVRLKKSTESEDARKLLIEEFTNHIEQKNYKVKYIQFDTVSASGTNEMLATYNVVCNSLIENIKTNGSQNIPLKEEIGSIDSLLKSLDVDALLIVRAMDEIPDGSRNATKAMGVVTGVLLGVSIIPYEQTEVSAGFINQSGKLDFFNTVIALDSFDIHKQKDVREIADVIFDKFPAK